MLDDLKYIHQKDVQDALGVAEKQWKQYRHDFGLLNLPEQINRSNIEGVILAGMGGSALAGRAFASIPGLNVPFIITRDYKLPHFVSGKWLLICSSYSGNTEETISVFNEAISMTDRPQIICVASGGELAKLAKKHDLPLVKIPGGYQPRFTFAYQYTALTQMFEALGLVKATSLILSEGSELVKKAVNGWLPTVPEKENLAKRIAHEIAGKSAVIYSSVDLFPAAYKWKISFNETSKNVAWCNSYSEFNHNEFLGWTSHPVQKPYQVIDLRSQHDHPQVTKRFEISDRLLSGKRPATLVVDIPKGQHVMHDMLWVIALGDFVSCYLALLNGLNPTPVDLIEKLKKLLD